MFDFANILFAGPCNRACRFCIGKQMPARVNRDNLDVYPPHGLDAFIEAVNRHRVRDVVLTGTTTDPQLYRHEQRLIGLLRARLHRGARLSLHTNGVRALEKIDVVNRYDRVSISLPSFEPETYAKMMGARRVPDLAAIVARARVPVKVSCVLDDDNIDEVPAFLARCRDIGVVRVVLRKLFGERREWRVLEGLPVVGRFRGNPVADLGGMEVTYWDFDKTRMTSLNLFADGTLGEEYLLTETAALRPRVARCG